MIDLKVRRIWERIYGPWGEPELDKEFSNGTIVERTPFSVFGWLWAFLNFFYLLFYTLIDPSYSKRGSNYERNFRPPGDGPPKPPTRKYGGYGPSGSGPSPPPMGGGCGCG